MWSPSMIGNMASNGIGLDVYVVVLGELLVSLALIAWARWKNRQESNQESTGSSRTGV
jgi:predicted negative regulator of RcsB-dependent stress response